MTETVFRKKIDLGGSFLFRTPGKAYTPIQVPSSYRCVGKAEFLKEFEFDVLEHSGGTVLLTTEGINYEGTLTLNGIKLGTTLPYCHYTYDVTELVSQHNTLYITVDDMHAPYGMTDGWCCCGGITRAIYLEILPKTYLSDFRFHNTFSDDFSRAQITVSADIMGDSKGCTLHAALSRNGVTVASAESTPESLSFSMPSPALWSPDTPNLYLLSLSLCRDGEVIDCREEMVGLKKLTMDNSRFYLNGNPFFFVGVCRHDLGNGEKGQTLSDEDIEHDLQMIKNLGANFVRLVHYPHDQRVIKAADRIGLLVSEESGLWWSDLNNQTLTDGAIEVLKRTILRDRNHVSVAFWMGFNECVFTQEFLNRSVEVCRKYDPDRFVSGANCMCPEMTVPMFREADIDFYTFHPYGNNTNSVSAGTKSPGGQPVNIDYIFKSFTGKPLIFTEWGGWNVTDNPALFLRFCNRMKRAKEEGKLAGMLYWAFADMVELNRDNDACHDGVQIEGLVTMDRKPKINYYVYREFIASLNQPAPRQEAMECHSNIAFSGGNTLPLMITGEEELQQNAWKQACQDAIPMGGIFKMRAKRTIKEGPVLPHTVDSLERLHFSSRQKPFVLNAVAPEVNIAVNRTCKRVHLLGNVLFTPGYPINDNFGEVCAILSLQYANGETKEIPLRNGIELLTVFTTYGSSFINPQSSRLLPAVDFSYNKNFENYRIYVLSLDTDSTRQLKSLTFSLASPSHAILLYGICTE